MPAARTIDEVIARLDAIVADSIRRGDRLGYFPALYARVTRAIRDAIQRKQFDDNARMERLDVIFANRYLAAYDAYRSGEIPSRSWLLAFNAARRADLIVLQHLLVGMNAHINLDLGVAAARVAPGKALPGLLDDFNRINDILAALTPVIEQELDQASPGFRILTSIAPRLELKIVGLGMREARNAAWKLAQELAPLAPGGQTVEMGERDGEATLLGQGILAPNAVTGAIWVLESKDVARNIRDLAEGDYKPPKVPQRVAAPLLAKLGL
jgi:hypothetical protein